MQDRAVPRYRVDLLLTAKGVPVCRALSRTALLRVRFHQAQIWGSGEPHHLFFVPFTGIDGMATRRLPLHVGSLTQWASCHLPKKSVEREVTATITGVSG